MNYRQKPNGMWIVDYLDDHGERKRVSTGIKTAPQRTPPPEAKAAGREIVLGVRPPKNAPASAHKARQGDGRLTMSDLFDKCEATVWHPDNARAQATIRSNLKQLRAEIGDEAVQDMSFTRLENLVLAMKAKGYAPATVKRKMDMVSKALRMATMWTDDKGQPLLGYKPPMPRIAVNNVKDRTISRLEEEALFKAVEQRRQDEPERSWFRLAALLRLLFETGARLGESLTLSPDNVADQGGRSYVTFPRYRTKSGKPRTLPLTEAGLGALSGLMDHLVRDRETGEWRFFGIKKSAAWYMFDQAKKDVQRETGMDLSDVTLHTIRHTTLTRLAQGGMELARLQLWAGHSDPKITAERYLHLIPSDLDGGASILERVDNTRPTIRNANVNRPDIEPNTRRGGNGATAGTPALH